MLLVLAVIAGSTAFVTRGRAAHRTSESLARLEESLDAAFTMLADEIRLAGYLGLAPPGIAGRRHPRRSATRNARISRSPAVAAPRSRWISGAGQRSRMRLTPIAPGIPAGLPRVTQRARRRARPTRS